MEGTARPALLADRYRLLEVIGSGGMSTVWRARDSLLRRDVAVKVLSERAVTDPAARARFEREAHLAASLSHPNIVSIFDVGIADDRAFIVMELVHGRSLRRVLDAVGSLPVAMTACVAADTLGALDHAHRKGLVHRDLKPGNILVARDGNAKLTDFGIAQPLQETTELTQEGWFAGTAAFASPEQLGGADVGPRSDLYSLACVLYQCLAGRPPFGADDPARVVLDQRFADPEPLGDLRPDVPEAMTYGIMRSLAKDPEERCPTAREMRSLFAPFEGGDADRIGLAQLTEPEPGLHDAGTPTDPTGVAPPADGPDRRGRPGRRLAVAATAAVAVVALVATALVLGSGGSPPRPQPSTLSPGDRLAPGQSLESPNGQFSLVMRPDGNLVTYWTRDGSTVPTWESATSGHSGAYAAMQADGDLVVYPPGAATPGPGGPASALWFTGTGQNPGAYVAIQDDGNLVVYLGNHALWESGATPGPAGAQLSAGSTLQPGQFLQSANGRYRLLDDPGLGALRLSPSGQPGCTLWQAPPVHGQAASVAVMQADGNLVLYAPGRTRATWQSETAGNQGAFAVLEDSGVLVVSSPSSLSLWHSPRPGRGSCG